MIRKAKAVWRGAGRDTVGSVGRLAQPYRVQLFSHRARPHGRCISPYRTERRPFMAAGRAGEPSPDRICARIRIADGQRIEEY